MFNVENGDILSGIYHRIYHRMLWKKIGANHQHSWLNQPYSDGMKRMKRMKRMGLGGA